MKRTGITMAVAAALLTAAAVVRAGEAAPPAPEPAAEPAAQQAQAPPEQPRPEIPPDLRRVLDKLDEANAKLVDVHARVTYTRLIPLLDDKRKSKGELTFKKPNMLVMKLKPPRNEEVRTNGRTWWVVSHGRKQVEVYRAATEDEGDSTEAAFLAFGYGRSSEELLKDYDAELMSVTHPEDKDDPALYRVKFTPVKRPGQAARYGAIEVVIGDKLWLPGELILHERGGEVVHIYELSKIETNEGVKDSLFEYEPPSSYQVETMDGMASR